MPIIGLTWKSMNNRRGTVFLTWCSIALSTALLLGVERVRHEARDSFANTISATDIVVGGRSGAIQLLLYSVFHIGHATNNVSWKSYQDIARHPKVSWIVPLSLGDSHRGYRVLGTTPSFFEHFRYGRKQSLEFSAGQPFRDLYEAVIGGEVAERLGYRPGDAIVVAHGAGKIEFARHDDKPFRVAGVLKRTGTPVDRSVLVALEAIEAIHIDWQGGALLPGMHVSAEEARSRDLTPKSITAALVGLKSRVAVFQVQRFINDYPEEPLSAIMPGVALQELWDLMKVAENALLIVSWAVVLVGLTGMLNAILAGLNERRREMAILRSVGARPVQISMLLAGEAGLLSVLGSLSGLAALYASLFFLRPFVENRFGLSLGVGLPTVHEWKLLGLTMVVGLVVGIIPAWRAYRLSLADGMTVRV